MCGIAGYVNEDGVPRPDDPALVRMISTLRHRGLDGFGFYERPGIGLAHARLSIIDLVSGGQPLDNVGVQRAITDGKSKLGKRGRLVIRPSGTEPVIRVMAEGDDEKLVKTVVSDIVHALTDAAA